MSEYEMVVRKGRRVAMAFIVVMIGFVTTALFTDSLCGLAWLLFIVPLVFCIYKTSRQLKRLGNQRLDQID